MKQSALAGVIVLSASMALAEGEEFSEFATLKFAPDLEQCRQALATGNVLKVEGEKYFVYFDVALFIIEADLDGMKCTAARHINK